MNAPFVIVSVAGDRVAVAAERVNSVIEIDKLIPVPRAPHYILGLTSLRSRTLTVIDTARALGLAATAGAEMLALVVEIDGCGYALLVDAVEKVEIGIALPCQPDVQLAEGWQRAVLGRLETDSGSLLIVDLDAVVARQPRAEAA